MIRFKENFLLTLQFSSVGGAGALIQQTVHVRVQKSLGVEDNIDVDVVVLRRVFVFWEYFTEQEANRHESNQYSLHLG